MKTRNRQRRNRQRRNRRTRNGKSRNRKSRNRKSRNRKIRMKGGLFNWLTSKFQNKPQISDFAKYVSMAPNGDQIKNNLPDNFKKQIDQRARLEQERLEQKKREEQQNIINGENYINQRKIEANMLISEEQKK